MEETELLEGFPRKEEFGSLGRKRDTIRIYRNKLIRMSKTSYWCSGAYPVDKNGDYCSLEESIRLKRYWRGQRSHYIKKECNRRFRRSNKLNKIYGKQRGLYRRALEFWWEYD